VLFLAYEIPKNLKYEEKILFNLSIWQALWVGLFGVLVVIIFFRTPLIFEIKVVVGIFLGLLGIGFAFLDLKKHLQTVLGFFLKPRQAGYLDKKVNNFLDVKKIGDDTVFLKDNSEKAIVQVQPINFHILSQRQQQAIISAYNDFLNSLDFPIQIVMRTVNLSLEEYLNQLEIKVMQQKKQKLKTQFNEFQEFIRNYIEEHAVKNRLFYIVVPNEKKAPANQLDIRVKLCQEKLANCNLTTKRLSTNELVSLLSSYFEGFIEAENEYQSMITLLEQKNVVPKEKTTKTIPQPTRSA